MFERRLIGTLCISMPAAQLQLQLQPQPPPVPPPDWYPPVAKLLPTPPSPPSLTPQAMESGPRIVIDLDWEGRMTHNDMRHLVQQLSFSYAANKQVARPAHLLLTSFKGEVAALANKMISGGASGVDRRHRRKEDREPSRANALTQVLTQ
jgi:hypothetical protein